MKFDDITAFYKQQEGNDGMGGSKIGSMINILIHVHLKFSEKTTKAII